MSASSADPPSQSGEIAVHRSPDEDAAWKVSPFEVTIAAVVFVMLAAGRWCYAHSHPWNSDEPQHLHVVWAWTAGLLPYRDVFDNHSPLFQWITSPLLLWFGERADIVIRMRLAMLPLFGISLWCIYRLGASLYSQRVGLWATLLAAGYPDFFFGIGEFRTDVLWTMLWLAALVLVVGGQLTLKRLFFGGLLLGAALGVSMKTTLLLVTLIAAGGLTWLGHRRSTVRSPEELQSVKKALPFVAAALGGMLIVPAIILVFFAAKGALHPMYYCVIQHNTLPGDNLAMVLVKRMLSRTFFEMLGVLALGAAMLPLLNWDPNRWTPRLFFLLVTGLFFPLLNGLWPVVTRQDYLPWIPLVAVHIAAVLLLAVDGLPPGWRSGIPRWLLPLVVLCLELGRVLAREPILNRHHSDRSIQALATVLSLADPGEYVMDAKGETIFRPRPCYLVLENLTIRQLSNGTLADDIVPRLIETRTAVVRLSDRMSAKTQDFITQNYLSVGHARVLGKMLAPATDGVIRFNIVIPERYGIEAPAGTVRGTLDGRPLTGARWLEVGDHELQNVNPDNGLAVVWARAQERGFTPFHEHDAKRSAPQTSHGQEE